MSRTETSAQKVFEFQFQFLHFALQLLGALLSLSLQLFDRLLHRRDGLVLLRHLQLQTVFGFALGGGTHFTQAILHTLFDGQFQLAFGIVQFTLLFDEFGLRVLSLSQFFVTRLQHLIQFRQLAYLCIEFCGTGKLCLLGFFLHHASALSLELRRNLVSDLVIERSLCISDQLFLFADGLFALGNVFVLLAELLLELLARCGNQGGPRATPSGE